MISSMFYKFKSVITGITDITEFITDVTDLNLKNKMI